jgi:hypothetical protein
MIKRMISAGILAAVGLSACSEQSFTQLNVLDVFQQDRTNAVDLLVVIDNSCSMIEEQENLARNFEALIDTFNEAETDWQIAVTTTDVESEKFRGLLMAGEDEIIVKGPNGELDRVEYDREWVFAPGTALQLSDDKISWVSNDTGMNWCAATEAYSDGSMGTPGAPNGNCTGEEAVPPEPPEADEGPRAPKTGDLILTEMMAWSVGVDADCEWFELLNQSDDTIDMTGVTFRDRGNNMASAPSGFMVAPRDYVVVGRSADATVNCGAPVDFALETGFTLNHDVRVLSPDTLNSAELFTENVAQGTSGAGIELGLEGARLVFEEPQYTESNQAWLRDYASLALMFVSDENDVSPYSVDAYERYFRGLKENGFRDFNSFLVSAVVGKEPTTNHIDVSCVSDSGVAYYAQRYIEMASRTDGLVESICEDDFAPVVRELGLTLTGLELKFILSDVPRLDTLKVSLYANEDNDSLVAELERGVEYDYVPDGNFIVFSEEQVPPSEYFIVAKYDPLPEGARNDVEESSDE